LSSGLAGADRRWIALLLIVILLATFLAIRFTDLPGSSSDDDTPVLLARTGCFDMDLVSADHLPPVSVEEAEASVRAGFASFAATRTNDELPDDPDQIGERIWADYGELAPGTAGRIASGHAWVLVFDLERDASWWRRLTIQDRDQQLSVLYRPDSGEISDACVGEAG
jgi:hypothetical protein